MSDNILVNIAKVAVDRPNCEPFTYEIPEELLSILHKGDCVQVPFGRNNAVLDGFVIQISQEEKPKYRLKAILSCNQKIRIPEKMLDMILWGAKYYRCSVGSFVSAAVPSSIRKVIELQPKRFLKKDHIVDVLKLTKRQLEVYEQFPDEGYLLFTNAVSQLKCSAGLLNKLIDAEALICEFDDSIEEVSVVVKKENHKLTDEQQVSVNAIKGRLDKGGYEGFLLHGVTGSGKTLVYMDVIEKVIDEGKQAIVLLPEIGLTPQLAARFRQRFKRVAVWHSKFSDSERYKSWNMVSSGEIDLVIGTRSAIFAPFDNIGVIIVDEEHDSSYKQDKTPRYQGRDLSVLYATQLKIPIVLGSATPSLESIKNVFDRRYSLLQLKNRPAGSNMPTVKIIDMREECNEQKRQAILSKEMLRELTICKSNGNQSIVLLNRRGWSPSIFCRSCGEVIKCTQCDIGMTWHKGTNRLLCHFCYNERAIPTKCPACTQPALTSQGVGTEQLTDMLTQEVSGLKVLRMDADTVSKKHGHASILNKFASKEYDCLVGTQMVAKGMDFSNVTFVGVLSADHGLSQPDFRASERTFQLISQVSGRAGRGDKAGKVVVQAYDPLAPAIHCAINNLTKTFFNTELGIREEYTYPPYAGLVRFLWTAKTDSAVKIVSEEHAKIIASYSDKTITLLGPNPACFLKGKHRMQLLVKSPDRRKAMEMLDRIEQGKKVKEEKGVSLTIDVDPYSFS